MYAVTTHCPGRMLMAALLVLAAGGNAPAADPLTLQEGDRIVFVGNTFAERMRHFGYFETMLTARQPELGLTFRNLGWSADEVDLQPRPMDFGPMDTHLAEQRASVIFLSFGFNESFKGETALPAFAETYGELIAHLAQCEFDGRGPARLVPIAPLRTEPLPRGLPSPDHAALEPYSAAIRDIAAAHDTPLVDLYDGIPAYRDRGGVDERFTFNGIHVTETGDYHVARVMLEQLGFAARPHAVAARVDTGQTEEFGICVVEDLALTPEGGTIDLRWDRLPAPPAPADSQSPGHEPLTVSIAGLAPGAYRLHWEGAHAAEHTAEDLAAGVRLSVTPAHEAAEALRTLIIDKNQLFFDRWRAVNGYYIYGGRKQPFGVVSFPPEMNRFDELVQEREQEIHERVTTPVRATLTIEALAR